MRNPRPCHQCMRCPAPIRSSGMDPFLLAFSQRQRSNGARVAARAGEPIWRRGHGANLIGIPTEEFASASFNEAPRPVRISGVRATHPDLFHLLLEGVVDVEDAGRAFTVYMATRFGLAEDGRPGVSRPDASGRKRYRASYLRLLRGWAYDSNGPEGAVMKGWIESRFGLYPTYHKDPLRTVGSPAWTVYVEQKIGNRFHNNDVFSQLDLLYEYAQWALARFEAGRTHMRLYRGVNDFNEHQIIKRIDRRRVVLRLNNIVSFTTDRDVASCFGDSILEASVPMQKVLFFNAMLPRHSVKGEGEVLVIGGDYLVRTHDW